jgi:hypothetical protein
MRSSRRRELLDRQRGEVLDRHRNRRSLLRRGGSRNRGRLHARNTLNFQQNFLYRGRSPFKTERVARLPADGPLEIFKRDTATAIAKRAHPNFTCFAAAFGSPHLSRRLGGPLLIGRGEDMPTSSARRASPLYGLPLVPQPRATPLMRRRVDPLMSPTTRNASDALPG